MSTAAEVNGAIIRAISSHAGIPAKSVVKQLRAIDKRLVISAIGNLAADGVILIFAKKAEGLPRLALPNQLPVRRTR